MIRRRTLFGVLIAVLTSTMLVGVAAPTSATAVPTKVRYVFQEGAAQLFKSDGVVIFKSCPPTGSGEASKLTTSQFTTTLSGLTVNFRTGEPTCTDLRASFPSASGIKLTFIGGDENGPFVFQQEQYSLDGTVKPRGSNALRASGNLFMFRELGATTGFANIQFSFFWPEEGGVCQVSMFGPFSEF